jgi:hypothetical protein
MTCTASARGAFFSRGTRTRVWQYGFSGIHDVNQVPPNTTIAKSRSSLPKRSSTRILIVLARADALSLDEFVFNTEAHPMRIWR